MEFAKKTNMKIVFGLNGKVGKTEIGHNFTGQSSKQHSASTTCFSGAWNSSNAFELMKEFASEYDDGIFAYELGNEVKTLP